MAINSHIAGARDSVVVHWVANARLKRFVEKPTGAKYMRIAWSWH